MNKSKIIKLPVFLIFIFCGILLIYFSDICKSGIKDGLDICAGTIIPSLFPFICFSNIALGIFGKNGSDGLINKIYSRIFSVSGNTLSVLIFSLIGGYPIGPMMSADMLENGQIDNKDAKRLMFFCCNSGPAFSIVAVGMNMCESRKLGIFLCISVSLSAILTGIILGRFKKEKSVCKVKTVYTQNTDFSLILTLSVEKSTLAIIKICAWIVIFNMISKLILSFSANDTFMCVANAFLEVTAGCSANSKNPPVLAFILGFGGISVFFQVSEYLRKAGVKFYEFFASRLIIGALSAEICELLLLISPISAETLANGNSFALSSQSLPFSAMLIFSLGVFILDKKIITLKK